MRGKDIFFDTYKLKNLFYYVFYYILHYCAYLEVKVLMSVTEASLLRLFTTHTSSSDTGEKIELGQRDDAFGCLRSPFRLQVWAGKRRRVVLILSPCHDSTGLNRQYSV